MASTKKRWIHLNKYQARVLLLVLVPPVIILSSMGFLSNLFFEQLLKGVESGSMAIMFNLLAQWQYNFIFALWTLFTIIILVAYVVTRNLLGAFTRIFRELDEMADGTRPVGDLSARKHDDLANDLLERVNKLLKQ